jgi:hypothetical protein
MYLIEDYILYSFLCVKLQDSAISILNLDLMEILTSSIFAQCKV